MLILFYSTGCSFSTQLREELGRRGILDAFSLCCVEDVRARGMALPPAIRVVPAMLDTATGGVKSGKALFDHCLLGDPSRFHTAPPAPRDAAPPPASSGELEPMGGAAAFEPMHLDRDGGDDMVGAALGTGPTRLDRDMEVGGGRPAVPPAQFTETRSGKKDLPSPDEIKRLRAI